MRVMVVDDHAAVRKGLAAFLGYEKDMEVVALAESGEEALLLAGEAKPDVVLMDLSMPGMGGIEATKQMVLQDPEIRIVMLTSFGGKERTEQAFENGVVGYVLKDTPPEELLRVLRGLPVQRPAGFSGMSFEVTEFDKGSEPLQHWA